MPADNDELLCMDCGQPAYDAVEYDEQYHETWVYCRRCDCWTAHPDKEVP